MSELVPFFSIVIPTYNRSRLVTYAIDSVLKQTFGDFEIVVCDNGSADDTPDVVRRITDPRVRYVRTPRHMVIADNWEFARSHARGRMVLMLSDDDALVPTALQRFADEARRHDADFLFCGVAEYRDDTFPGLGRNTVRCPAFSGRARVLSLDEFVAPLFVFRSPFNMHPSAFLFERSLAELVASRCGRFFQTNGVEYCAWPLAAALARRIVYLDAPLCVLGRTGVSWGTNLGLANPGEQRIEEFIADVDHERKHAPLSNFTISNLWAEGLLTAKKLLAAEFSAYEFDEAEYLRKTMRNLSTRRSQGVDVSREIEEVLVYARKWPALAEELATKATVNRTTPWDALRGQAGKLGAEALVRRLRAYRSARHVRRGDVKTGFRVSGGDFRFYSIVGCAEFLGSIVLRNR
jgi:glycosyl transferase family 2